MLADAARQRRLEQGLSHIGAVQRSRDDKARFGHSLIARSTLVGMVVSILLTFIHLSRKMRGNMPPERSFPASPPPPEENPEPHEGESGRYGRFSNTRRRTTRSAEEVNARLAELDCAFR